uniref:CUB domain-containing protein n=1 Tax=Macrostomum lignano TaxID=282301 RepID=A0A1I8F1X3_9PLAT
EDEALGYSAVSSGREATSQPPPSPPSTRRLQTHRQDSNRPAEQLSSPSPAPALRPWIFLLQRWLVVGRRACQPARSLSAQVCAAPCGMASRAMFAPRSHWRRQTGGWRRFPTQALLAPLPQKRRPAPPVRQQLAGGAQHRAAGGAALAARLRRRFAPEAQLPDRQPAKTDARCAAPRRRSPGRLLRRPRCPPPPAPPSGAQNMTPSPRRLPGGRRRSGTTIRPMSSDSVEFVELEGLQPDRPVGEDSSPGTQLVGLGLDRQERRVTPTALSSFTVSFRCGFELVKAEQQLAEPASSPKHNGVGQLSGERVVGLSRRDPWFESVRSFINSGQFTAMRTNRQGAETDLLNSCSGVPAPTETGIVSAQGYTEGHLADCHLLLESMPGRQLVLSIENLQVRNVHLFHRRCDNYIQILAAARSARTVRDQQVFIVSEKFVRIQLHTTGPRYVHFRLVYTNALPASKCKPDMFKCKNKRLCVGKSLVCDRHNNCGDYSDENHELRQCQIVTYYHVNLAVSLACSLIVLLTLGFAIFYCTRPREPRWYRAEESCG